jgi:hypothetical protein
VQLSTVGVGIDSEPGSRLLPRRGAHALFLVKGRASGAISARPESLFRRARGETSFARPRRARTATAAYQKHEE